MAVGNIEAIRDWMIGNDITGVNGNWYNKEEINLIFQTPTTYHLGFFGLPNQGLIISEAKNSPSARTYNIQLNAQGNYEGNFDFISNKIKVRTTNNMLNESMLDLNNWIKNTPMSNAQFECVFEPYIKLTSTTQTITDFNGVNTVKFKGVNGYECIRFDYLDYNWDNYRLDVDFYTPTGFDLGENNECFTVNYPKSAVNAGRYYLSGYESIYVRCNNYTTISNEISNTFTHYYSAFKSSSKNDSHSAIFDYGMISDENEVTLKYTGLQIRRNP